MSASRSPVLDPEPVSEPARLVLCPQGPGAHEVGSSGPRQGPCQAEGERATRSLVALVSTGARMSMLDKALVDELGVLYTGRELTTGGLRQVESFIL